IGDITVHSIRTLVTDRDLALISAVRTELPHVKHQLCVWHIEQNIIKNLNSKLKDKFIAFNKDFKAVMVEAVEEKFNILWDCLLTEYSETSSYIMEQWKPYDNIIRQQCPELLVDISMVVSDFVYTLFLEQYNMAASYDINKQNVGLFQVYRNEDHKHTIYQTDAGYICFCNYNTQFSLPCHHIFTVHIADKEVMNVNYIGARWIVSLAESNTPQIENLNHLNENLVNNNEFESEFLPFSNHDINEISDQQKHHRSTVNLLKDIEAISNRVSHIKINSTLAHFVEQLNSKYPLLQDDIGDPPIAKTKGRLNSSKRKKIGAEHATKKNYICDVCNNSEHNSRSCPQK
ncbi:14827_t:CDS:2, partial [Cetraspora pellucida]